MNKKWITWIGILLLTVILAYVLIDSMLPTRLASENFPLIQKWSTRLNSKIEQISIVDNQFILARTGAEIYALNINTGEQVWHQETSWSATNEPVLANNQFVFFTDSKYLWALNQSDGKTLWQQKLKEGAAGVVDVSMDMVLLFDWQQLFVYRSTDGTLLLEKPGCRNSNLAHIQDNMLYIPCTGITAIAIETGETVWETTGNSAITAAAYSDTIQYSDPSAGVITAFNLAEQKQIWSTSITSDGVNELKIADEFLLMTDMKQFCVLRRSDGNLMWCYRGVSKPQNPVKVGDIAYISNKRQNVITAFDIYNGKQLGQLKITKFNPFIVFRQLMVSSEELLVFAKGKDIFVFGK